VPPYLARNAEDGRAVYQVMHTSPWRKVA
jgi:hypothetical protein